MFRNLHKEVTKAQRRAKYKKDYIEYWSEKGTYGLERIRRMRERKKRRAEKLLHNCKCGHNHKSGLHTCPYSEDMHGDYESLCTCCSDCTDACAGDI